MKLQIPNSKLQRNTKLQAPVDELGGEIVPRSKLATLIAEPSDRAVASWSAPVLWRFDTGGDPIESARGLAHSKTWRTFGRFIGGGARPASIGGSGARNLELLWSLELGIWSFSSSRLTPGDVL